MPTNRHVSRVVRNKLEDLFGNETMFMVARRFAAPNIIRHINERTARGEFLGGDRENEGYSTNPLPAWYFGDLSYNDDGSVTANPPDTRQVTFQADDIFWAHFDGRANPMFQGGYKGFRKLSGRQTSPVNLTMTGTMLRGLDSKTTLKALGASIRVGIFNQARDYAGYVNNQREFLGLNEREKESIAKDIQRGILRQF